MMTTKLFDAARSVTLAILMILCLQVSAAAHSPHDDIFDVEVMSHGPGEPTVFVVVRSAVMVSHDGGDSWQRVVRGLDHKNILYALDVAPDDRTLYLTTLGDGVYRSRDAGQSWSRLMPGPPEDVLDTVAVDPKAAEHVFVAGMTGGLYRSTDGGANWRDVTGELSKVTAIAFHPEDAERVYVATDRGELFESSNGGETWARRYGPEPEDPIVSLSVSAVPAKTPVVLLGTRSGAILRSDEAASAFTPVWRSVAAEPVVAFGSNLASPQNGRIHASLAHEGVYYSDDAGRTWRVCSNGLTRDVQASEVGRPSFGPLAVVETDDGGSTVFLAGFDGLFASESGACDWRQVETLSSSNIVGIAPAPNFAQTREVFVTNWLWGVHRSLDGGESWTSYNNGNMDYVRDNGLTRMFDIVFSPNFGEDRTMFSSTWYHLLKSSDGGKSWRQIEMIGDDPWKHHGLVIDVSAGFEEDGTLYAGTHRGLVLKSIDRGETFRVLMDTGSTIGGALALSGADGAPLVFVGDTHGVHRSRDGGETWQFTDLVGEHLHFEILPPPHFAEPVGSNFVKHLQVQRGKALAIKLAASPNVAEDLTLFAGTANGLFVTRDGGESWTLVENGDLDGESYIETVAVSPNFAEDGLVLVSARGVGHFRSRDGGRSFSKVAPQLVAKQRLLAHFPGVIPKFPAIVFSPTYAQDKTIFGQYDNHLLRSVDAGETWEMLHSFLPSFGMQAYVEARYRYQLLKRFVRDGLLGDE